MKNIFIFSALISLTFFFSCSSSIQPLENDFVPAVQEPALPGTVGFLIETENDIHEQDVLVVDNSSENAVSYHWDFGNGDSSTDAQPTYTYSMHGSYAVKLTITDAFGDTYQASQEITVLCIFGGGLYENHN